MLRKAATGSRFTLLFPIIQIDTPRSRLTRSVDRKDRFDAFAFAADGKGGEEFVPALRSFFQVGSLGISSQPLVQLGRHRCNKLSLINPLAQMLAICTATSVPGRPDLNCRHGLSRWRLRFAGKCASILQNQVGSSRAERIASAETGFLTWTLCGSETTTLFCFAVDSALLLALTKC